MNTGVNQSQVPPSLSTQRARTNYLLEQLFVFYHGFHQSDYMPFLRYLIRCIEIYLKNDSQIYNCFKSIVVVKVIESSIVWISVLIKVLLCRYGLVVHNTVVVGCISINKEIEVILNVASGKRVWWCVQCIRKVNLYWASRLGKSMGDLHLSYKPGHPQYV